MQISILNGSCMFVNLKALNAFDITYPVSKNPVYSSNNDEIHKCVFEHSRIQ